MKRIIPLILIINILVFCFAGCATEDDIIQSLSSVATTSSEPFESAAATTAAPAEETLPSEENTEQETTEYVPETVAPAPLYANDEIFNVIMIGSDGNDNYGRSDTLMLLSIDNIHSKIKMTSFLRDTYVNIPGYGMDKLNAAYAYGGTSLCIDAIEYNFGVDIDGYAIVNFTTFRELINAIGGVDVYLTTDEIDYINAQVAQNNQANSIPAGTTEGVVHLTGGQALWHVRNRGGEVNGTYFYGTDWDRVNRQQRMFEGIIDGLRSISFEEVRTMAYTVLPYITTDIDADALASHIMNAPAYLTYGIERMSVPVDYWQDSYYYHAGSVLEITDWDSLRHDVAAFVYEDIE